MLTSNSTVCRPSSCSRVYSHVKTVPLRRHTQPPGESRQERPRGLKRKGREKRRLTVLEGAAMVSISSWVTHTLPDGYVRGGPKRDSSSSIGSSSPVGGASSVKEEEQHHCKPIVLQHHGQMMKRPHPSGVKGRTQVHKHINKHTSTAQNSTIGLVISLKVHSNSKHTTIKTTFTMQDSTWHLVPL